MPITIQELERLREERAARQRQVEELQRSLVELEEELARLKGEEPPPVAAKVPWYKSWKTYLTLGGLATLVGGIVIYKTRKK